jgi:hypothetical protein
LAVRFHFNSVDTLPYWYEPASEIFAQVSTNELAVAAERWILDRWKESAEVWRWADEPRKWRYPERDWHLWVNDHGSMPTIERHNTYLEWHAMCCAVGELLNTRHLALTESFDFDRFENWLARYQLAYPPRWLADLRGPKPLEIRMWLPPTQTESATWLESAEDHDFLTEIGIGGLGKDRVVVWADHETRSSELATTVSVRTALVQPETAGALLRALQTVEEPHRYGIPSSRNQLEIDEPPYRLLSWLDDFDSESGIDKADPLRSEIRGPSLQPGVRERAGLTQSVSTDGAVSWRPENMSEEYLYEEWSDGDTVRRSSNNVSNGSRLWVSISTLRERVLSPGFDLLARVQVTRRRGNREYQRENPKETTEVRYDRVYLLRRNGIIEGAEGRVGTWRASGA